MSKVWRCGWTGLALSIAGCMGWNLGSSSQEGQNDDDLRPLTGAIWTTNSTGERVNQNQYEMMCDVYLNGGPDKEGAAGLPEGDYYFQVTEPSGSDNDPEGGPSKLLTTDDIEFRQFHVGANGEIDGVSGAGNRPTETSGGGDVLIQLCPYILSSNPGCVHKVWVTPVSKYDPDEKSATFGFVHRWSKTDNFKVCQGEDEGPDEEEGGDETAP